MNIKDVGTAINDAAKLLPGGYEISLIIMRDGFSFVLYSPDGAIIPRTEIALCLSDEISAIVEVAILHNKMRGAVA